MPETNPILSKMLDRLLAGLINGPSLNCRPHASRQRLDMAQFSKLADITPEQILRGLLGSDRKGTIKARVTLPRGAASQTERQSAALAVAASIDAADETGFAYVDPLAPAPAPSAPAAASPLRAWAEQQAVLNKLHTIAEDARTYEQDTGVSVLNVGFPLLSLPPGAFGGSGSNASRRVLAPLAFVPVSLTVKRGAAPAVELACKADGVDRVMPNVALFAWMEQQSGKTPAEHDEDESGTRPWKEICAIVRVVCAALDLPAPELFNVDEPPEPPQPSDPATAVAASGAGVSETAQTLSPAAKADVEIRPFSLAAAPKADDADARPEILCSAVLGLFPMANQGLLRDTQAMLADPGALTGPVQSFIRKGVSLEMPPGEPPAPDAADAKTPPLKVVIAEERSISSSDPCQARAVRLARQSTGLVVHGPPGSGKSQTITNIVGDHLARGQRVLIVCDKRTALDVVYHRLAHMGLGNLCALVHDPRRDQRELYKSLRQQLDELSEAASDARAEGKLQKADAELQQLHDELSGYRDALVRREGDPAVDFHERVGQWLAIDSSCDPSVQLPPIDLGELESAAALLGEILTRAELAAYGVNPWKAAAGISLPEFLALPMEKVRRSASDIAQAAAAADATRHPDIPPFSPTLPLEAQGAARTKLADDLSRLLAERDPQVLRRWAGASPAALAEARRAIAAAQAFAATLASGPLDAELLANLGGRDPAALPIAEHLQKLTSYLESANKWFAFLPSRAKTQAGDVLAGYALPRSPENARRASAFLVGLRARTELSRLVRTLAGRELAEQGGSTIASRALTPALSSGSGGEGARSDDAALQKGLADHSATLDFLLAFYADANVAGLSKTLAKALRGEVDPAAFLEGLRRSAARAAALAGLERGLGQSRLFAAEWLAEKSAGFRAADAAEPALQPLRQRIDSLEGVLRVRQGLEQLSAALRPAAVAVLDASLPADVALATLRRQALADEISRRLAADPHLQQIDPHRLQTAFDRYRELDEQKRGLTRAVILHRWLSKQKDRLLATTKSRVNSLGADLRRRLMLRGERAMRLRQVVAAGAKIEGGDPLFDLCPIWLASPETVAQVFPREAVFDVLVFDEASQLRLEEALPVLVRGKRVVIAGDPRQLPPTRFFESAFAASEEEDAQTDQQLFEQQQGEVEDLLSAALGLDIQQCYLDVHYRSRNADLIAFSNEHFYGRRLQPIPAHPTAPLEPTPPVEIERVEGVYEKRRNVREAERVVAIVQALLERKEPPSIGIACFNLSQRDLVVEKLDELAAREPAFARRLEAARTRQGAGSFEGLFVKNLENVQGDERDYILVSTTYGPDKSGKFYRRFGPLGRAGGGRRLNVLVTRAREKVHVLCSIPPAEYRSLPLPEPGQTPGGAWLLFAYLKFAEDLALAWERAGKTSAPAASNGDASAGASVRPAAKVSVRPAKNPSPFAEALARRLSAEHHLSSEVHWGNEGFCVDIAARAPGDGPANGQGGPLGILCDTARFAAADDPMQWDIFRTTILEQQGWKLHRLWTPHFYRDPGGAMKRMAEEVGR